MKIINVNYCCIPYPAKSRCLSLRMDAWHVKMFPLTYTVQECLEEWCEEVGWRYISHTGGLSNRQRCFWNVRVEMRMYENEISTILAYVREKELCE